MDIDSINTFKNIRSYNGYEIGKEFIEYFYAIWSSINQNNLETNNLLTSEIIKSYTKLRYNSCTYKGIQIIQLLASFDNIQFNNCKYEILDSDSRQIYILVNGNMISNNMTKNFCQSFSLMYAGGKEKQKWNLTNSLLLIN